MFITPSYSLRCRHAPLRRFLGGGLAANRMGEDHEVVFVVAADTTTARRAAKEKGAVMSTPWPVWT
ncbi:MAG: hypothetical protein ACLPVF_19010 [Acidimicrobiales bacterium]